MKTRYSGYSVGVVSTWRDAGSGKLFSSTTYSWDQFNCKRAARHFGLEDLKKLRPSDRLLTVVVAHNRKQAKRRNNKTIRGTVKHKPSNYFKKRKQAKT